MRYDSLEPQLPDSQPSENVGAAHLHRLIAANIPGVAIALFDRDLRFSMIEGPALPLIGLSRTPAEGLTIHDLDPELAQLLEPRYRRTLAGESHSYETEFRGRIFVSQYLPVPDDTGQITHGLIISRDITSQTETAHRLSKSEQRLHLALESTRIGTWEIDLVNEVVYRDERAWELLGGTGPQDIPLQDLLTAVHPADRESVQQDIETACDLAGTGTYQTDCRILRPDGQIRWLHNRGVVIMEGAGSARRPVSVIGTSLDLTESKITEENLHQRAEELATLMDLIPAAIWVSPDPACEQMTGNRRANEFYEAADHENISANVSNRRQFFQDGRELSAQELPMQVAATTGRDVRDEEIDVLLPSGRRITIWGSASPLHDSDGNVRGAISAFMDTTDRKRAEEQMRQARDQLEQRVLERTAQLQQRADQLARLTSELTLVEQRERRRLAQVLHDHLQQLLVAAQYGLEMLMRRSGSTQQKQVTQISSLLNEAIDASRDLTVELSPPILHEGGLAAGLEWLARRKQEKYGLTVDLDLDERRHKVCDEVKILLFQSVRELLFNIHKHAGVEHAGVRLAHEDDQIKVTVSDSGNGFDCGQMWDRAGETNGGFGLVSIRERLERLGGQMKIRSAPGQGACFTLCVPARLGEILPELEAQPGGEPLAPELMASDVLAPGQDVLRVLLVDDHAVVRQGLLSLLEDEPDIEVVAEATDGIEAVEKARELRPDVVLMDFSMPGMDGVEATRAIRAELPHTRIIGLSVYSEADRATAMIAAGADGYFTKSGDIQALLLAIR
ncbi:MAG: response regulator [Thiogranum sp.]|nr:response regulator [Thiogranum sp.]